MRLFRVKLKLTSPFATEWQSDTIWGHLCWVMRFTYGEPALADFISRYQKNTPPLLVSNGFPSDFLPRCILPDRAVADRDSFAKLKLRKKSRWLSLDEFNRMLSGDEFMPAEKAGSNVTVTVKNQINRITNTTAGRSGDESDGVGHLFNFTENHLDTVSIYLKIADDFMETARELFDNLSRSGYGKRKTVGYGQFSIQSFDEFAGLASPEDANGFVSLSNFVPAVDDPTVGYWELLVKYGKLGEEYAIMGNPHKKPLVMLKAGSCFYDNPCRDYYGRLVKGLSLQYPEVVQYGYAMPVPIKLPE